MALGARVLHTRTDSPMDKTLTEQIAASEEDVKSLLESNRSLSVALLARLLKEQGEHTRKRFQAMEDEFRAYREQAGAAMKKQDERITAAGRMFHDMQRELEKLKSRG
jgi:hypothetical protein